MIDITSTIDKTALESLQFEVERHRLLVDKFIMNRAELGDLKKAIRTLNNLQEKSKKNKLEILCYKIVKAYVLSRCNKRSECLSEIDEAMKEIIDDNIVDYNLIDQSEQIIREIGCF